MTQNGEFHDELPNEPVEPTESELDEAGARADAGRDKSVTAAEEIVRIALQHYRFGCDDKEEPFAVARNGPNLALMLRGSGDSLRARLSKQYRLAQGRTPSAQSLADAMLALHGESLESIPEPVSLRIGSHGGGVVIDLGDPQGRAVIVRPNGWEVVERSPILFRRTRLISAMPIPERGGTLESLRRLLNVNDDSWQLVVGFSVAAMMPDLPHPILLMNGLQGTGKSCAARMLVDLLDPSPAPLRSEPRDMEQWQTQASGSWVVCLDNISAIHPWLADVLCRSSTGDGCVRRRLYSDGDLYVLAFRRVVMLTSIDAGAMRGDLGERLLVVDLEPISSESRRSEADVMASLVSERPKIFGALLDALSRTFAELPSVQLTTMPRMADFGRVLAACDLAGVTNGALDIFNGQQGRIAQDVVDGDPFGTAIVEFMVGRDEWEGTSTELLEALLPNSDKIPPGWPRRNGVTGRLKRLTPALQAQGIGVGHDRVGHSGRRIIRLLTGLEAATRGAPKTVVRNVSVVSNRLLPGFRADDADDDDNSTQAISGPVVEEFTL